MQYLTQFPDHYPKLQRQKSRGAATWEGKQEPEEEHLRASFAPELRRYIQETPTDRWRERQILGVRSRVGSRARDEAGHNASPSPHPRSLQSEVELAWKRSHIASLLPPYQEREEYQEYREPGYTRKGMRNWAQLLATPTADTPGTTVLLHFDNKRYLIGSLAEGTQRACVQMGARLLKVQECFLTGKVEWSNTGGLIGMILTLADAAQSSRDSSVEDAAGRALQKARRMKLEEGGSEMREMVEKAKREVREARLTVFGPENLNHATATARRFVFRKGMPVDLHEVRDGKNGQIAKDDEGAKETEDEWTPYWADENIKVWPMSISPATSRPVTLNGVGSVSPRKRSIDEVYMNERAEAAAPNGSLRTPAVVPSQLSQAEKDTLTRKAVVNEMFNSSWRLDALYETPLSQVKLPATIFVRNPETKKVEKYRGPLPGSGKQIPDPDMTVLVRQPWPGALVESLPPTQPSRVAMSYIIKNHIQRGKFHPERAKECKVEKGQKWSQLQKGESVENVDGETITPDMVLGEPKEGGGIAVVALPDKAYIDALLARPEWQQEKIMNGVGAIVWSCGEGVAADERIQAFMRELKNVKHIVSSPEYCPNEISLDSVTASTIRLGKVDPARYNVPVHQDDAVTQVSLPENAEVGQRGMIFQTEPKLELQRNQIPPPFSIADVEKQMPAEVLEMASQAQKALADSAEDPTISAWKEDIPNKDAEVITLGTGSALPSKYRNVSSTLVRVPGWGNILLDAGENTIGQLKRVFTADEMKQVLRDLRILVISHMHADHHLGTVGVLKAWYREVHSLQPLPAPDPSTPVQDLLAAHQPQRLAVISEPAMQQWLTEYADIEDFGLSRLTPLVLSPADPTRNRASKLNWFIPPSQLANSSRAEVDARMTASIIPPSLIGLSDAQAVLVQHCHGARAVSLTLPSGFKVSYSGDCRPSKNFVHIGQGSTVVIHESTFDDELAGDAQAKNHSTMSEALGVAQGMRAKACVLTHFSQRYQKMPVLEHAPGAGEEPPAPPVEEDVVDEGEDPEQAGNDDVAQTFPDQSTSNGSGGASVSSYKPFSGTEANLAPGPAPVRFKLSSDMKVAVAFDYMRVRVGDMWQMDKFTPALLKLFEEEEAKKVKDGAEEKGGPGGGGAGKKEKRVKGKKSRESMK